MCIILNSEIICYLFFIILSKKCIFNKCFVVVSHFMWNMCLMCQYMKKHNTGNCRSSQRPLFASFLILCANFSSLSSLSLYYTCRRTSFEISIDMVRYSTIEISLSGLIYWPKILTSENSLNFFMNSLCLSKKYQP